MEASPLRDALAERALAEARRAQAEARKAEAEARAAEVAATQAEREEKDLMADWRWHNVVDLYGTISEVSVLQLMGRLNLISTLDPTCAIEIVLNSHGGDAFWGMCLYDYIGQLRKTHKVTIIGLGSVMSMAAVLLQAADVRVMGSQAWLVIHKVKTAAMGSPEDIQDVGRWADKMCDRVKAIFVNRSAISTALEADRLTAADMEELWKDRKDWTLDADEALRRGLIDEIR